MVNPTITIVGRPNVGKSTIFSRTAGGRISIVEDTPGVTRDRIYTTGEWLGREFSIIDTDGVDLGDEPFMDQVKHQAEIAIDEVDVTTFVASGREEITGADELVTGILYHSNKPMILAVNKIDNPEMRNDIYGFYALGLGNPFPISGSHRLGIGDVLGEAVKHFPSTLEEEDGDTVKLSLIRRPSAGKSSLTNAVLSEDRVIVLDIEGTTQDAIDTYSESEEGQKFLMVDIAGMRKRGRVYESTERYSVMRAMWAVERSDIALMVLNAEKGIREQDKRVAGHAHEAGRSTIIVISRWDTVKKDTSTMRDFEAGTRDKFQYLDYAPIIFVSTSTKQRLNKLPELIETVSMNQNLRIPSALLNDVVMDTVAISPTPTDRGERLKIFYVTQVAVKPPTSVIFVNEEELIHFSYTQFLENQIREAFTFKGMPIKIIL